MTAMLADIISRFGKDVHAKLDDSSRLASRKINCGLHSRP